LWELICHHTYKWNGLPIDLSYYDNHGKLVGLTEDKFLPDGIAPKSGAWRFVQHANQVRVPLGAAWSPLVALRIEVTARLTDPSTASQTLIEGDNSFSLFVATQALCAFFRGKSIYPGVTGDGVNTYKDGLDFPGYRVPFGKWVNIVFMHDGFSQMRLYVDGEPVTLPRSALSGIPPVGPNGVSIGNSIDGNSVFGGDIDEIKIWRLDPRSMSRQFLDRPFDKATADCWTRYVQSMRAAFVKYPDCAKQLVDGIEAALDRWLRAVCAQGPETRQRFDEVRERYAILWREGNLAGPEMRTLLDDWCVWLRLVGIAPEGDDTFAALEQSECWKLIQRELAGIDCDPEAMALVKLLGEECGPQAPRPPGRRPSKRAKSA
jgi:hypothetical protein